MFEYFKPILGRGERYIVVEDGRPEYVVLSYDDYVALAGQRQSNPGLSHSTVVPMREAAERANAELELAGDGRQGFGGAMSGGRERPGEIMDPATIRLEDLPL